MFLGQAIYMLPEETLKAKIEAEGFREQDLVTAEEKPYGAPSKKLKVKTLADPVIIQTETLQNAQTEPRTSNPVGAAATDTPGKAMSFDANNKEKVFVLVVLITVLTYIYFKFF